MIKNKFTRIINEWSPKSPLYPSIKLAPLITNKKHKQIKIKEKIFEFSIQLFKNSIPVLSREKLLGMMAGGEELDKLEVELQEMDRINKSN